MNLGRPLGLGALARDAAWARLRGSAEGRARVVRRLGSLHGLPQKIGQILALAELPSGADTYAPLTEGAAAMPPDEAFALLQERLGRPLADCYLGVAPEGTAASLGQVHRALLRDGREVAVKIQYPNVREDLEFDLRAIDWLSLPLGGFGRGFDLEAYRSELGGMMREELDYRHEAALLREFGDRARALDWLTVPEVIEELSTDRVLTMTWVEGESFRAVAGWSVAERETIARHLVRLFLRGALDWRLLHADPNPGNYRFARRNGRVTLGLLDYGCVKRLQPTDASTLTALLQGVRHDSLPDGDRLLSYYVALGFDAKLTEPMAHLLPALTRLVFEPFGVRGPFDLSRWNLGPRAGELLGELRWNLRTAGPAGLLFFVRSYQGLLQYLKALGVAIDWAACLDEVLAGAAAPAPAPVPVPATSHAPTLARHLRVRVCDNGSQRVELTFRAQLAADLPDLVPEDVGGQLAARAVDVHAIARTAAEHGFPPGELFELRDGAKHVRVWLE